MTEVKKTNKDAHQRAARIRALREALKLSRQAFAEKYAKHGITYSALESWELVRWDGLTLTGAEKLCKAFMDEGIEVTLTWLLAGEGNAPMILLPNKPELPTLADEIDYLKKLYPSIVTLKIEDDLNSPICNPSDVLIGLPLASSEFDKAIGRFCIVNLENEWLARKVLGGIHDHQYSLYCMNPDKNGKEYIKLDIQLINVAPVHWIRKNF